MNNLTFLSFWSINDALDLTALTSQMDELRAAGLDGVVFHPRYYTNEPVYMGEPYLAIVSELILHAKRTGMIFWLYDENGWPSGTAGGQVLEKHAGSTCRSLRRTRMPDGRYELLVDSWTAISSLDIEATKTFIEITHEGYRKGLKPEAFAYVEGFFSDEVAFLDGHGVALQHGAVPWDDRLPERYRERHGEELMPLLPLLFADDEGYERVRIRFWELLTDMLVEGFYRPIEDWCAKHGKRFTAHVKAEEHPYFQLSYSGSCFQVLQGVETPAVDALERYPGNHFYPRIAHSVAVQQGRKGCLAEAMGGSGWGITPESFERYALWLAGHGIDQFVLHLNQFRLKTQAMQDWPPSMPCHLTWKDAFPSVLQSVRMKARELPDLRAEPDALIVVPTRGTMAAFIPEEAMELNEHDGSNVPDSFGGRLSLSLLRLVDACFEAGIHYELTEERAIEEEGRLSDGAIHIGFRTYGTVILAEGCRISDSLADEWRRSGVRVLEAGQWRDAMPSNDEVAISEEDPRIRIVPEQTPWRISQAPANNRLPISFAQQIDGSLTFEVAIEESASITGLSLLLLDPVEECSVNGQRLTFYRRDEGYVADIPDEIARNAGERLLIRAVPAAGGEACPAAWIRGEFAVASLSPYAEKDERQRMTSGPFKVTASQVPQPSDMIASGYPFAGRPVILKKTIAVEKDLRKARLKLFGVQASAINVRIGDTELGWHWGPVWSIDIPEGLRKGAQDISVTIVPSGYNVYGPHRHIDGDRHLTSPDQYKGNKNFADRADAPERTLSGDWHFVKWGIEEEQVVLEI
ncbi:hypothetical protein [Cohnella sp. GCM10027633]|uniref:hypothetical protein n=1 Tax=unclassified Cohnella TaxID=2636738 RepID=UPI003635C8C6